MVTYDYLLCMVVEEVLVDFTKLSDLFLDAGHL